MKHCIISFRVYALPLAGDTHCSRAAPARFAAGVYYLEMEMRPRRHPGVAGSAYRRSLFNNVTCSHGHTVKVGVQSVYVPLLFFTEIELFGVVINHNDVPVSPWPVRPLGVFRRPHDNASFARPDGLTLRGRVINPLVRRA